MLPVLEPILNDVRRTRRVQTRYMRIYAFDCYYRALLMEMVPLQTLCLPNAQNVQEFPLVQRLIQDDLDATTDYSSRFTSSTAQLLASMGAWMELKKKSLLGMLPQHLRNEGERMFPRKAVNQTHEDVIFRPSTFMTNSGLDDAASVFVHLGGEPGALIGSEVTQSWKSSDTPLVFSQRGSETAQNLLDLLHNAGKLRTTRATALELDRMDNLYFSCLQCHGDTSLIEGGHASAYTWRACVSFSDISLLPTLIPHPFS